VVLSYPRDSQVLKSICVGLDKCAWFGATDEQKEFKGLHNCITVAHRVTNELAQGHVLSYTPLFGRPYRIVDYLLLAGLV